MHSMTKPNYQKAHFLLSVANLSQLPPDEGVEVAIIGRSNSGKSSALNQLTQNSKLARVSKTPGRTQFINLFGIDEKRRIADLPGYGYAKVPSEMKASWQQLLDTYLRTRECLKGLILVMDIRHPLKDFDQYMLDWTNEANIPTHILLNKADKLTKNHQRQTLFQVTEVLPEFGPNITIQLFSALRGVGIEELRAQLNEWFD